MPIWILTRYWPFLSLGTVVINYFLVFGFASDAATAKQNTWRLIITDVITQYHQNFLIPQLDLSQQGELLMQGSFLVVSENKRDIRLRIRPRRRHIFLYEKAMLFCKPATKNSHNKATYHFKHDLQVRYLNVSLFL